MNPPPPPPSPLSPPLLRGMIVIYVFATLSTLGLVSIFLRIIYFAIHRKLASRHSVDYVFFDTQLGRYAASLLMANLLNGISGMISLRWILERKIIEGSVCTAQAIIMQTGNWGTAFFTVTIAIHTFNSLVLRRRQSTIVWTTTVALGWTMSILLAILPTFHNLQFGPIYGADTDACGVRRFYPMKQFSFHLLPIFIASVLSALLYSIIFLVLRGTLVIKGGFKFTLDPHERWKMTGVSENYQRFVASIARSMLWFPIAYISLLVPYSIMRLLK
ncbi:hypothetical protein BD779DRAFT_567214 [Infundibulicybe gibba]|nr:hypothetical protein BD779DRAFT_567214 [Infundibulicybe gibba]